MDKAKNHGTVLIAHQKRPQFYVMGMFTTPITFFAKFEFLYSLILINLSVHLPLFAFSCPFRVFIYSVFVRDFVQDVASHSQAPAV